MKTLFWNYRTKSRRCNRRLGLAKSLFCNDLHVCYYHSNYLRQVLIDWFSFSWLYTITLVVISFTEIDSRLACNAKGLKFFCPQIWKVITGIWNQILAQIFCIMLKEISEIHILHTICSWHKDVPVRPKVIWPRSQSHHQHGILCWVHTVLKKKYKKIHTWSWQGMLMTLRCVMTLTQSHFIKVNQIINNLHFITCSTREEPLNFCLLYTKYMIVLYKSIFLNWRKI